MDFNRHVARVKRNCSNPLQNVLALLYFVFKLRPAFSSLAFTCIYIDVTPPRWASLVGCARVQRGSLTRWVRHSHDVQLSSWSGTRYLADHFTIYCDFTTSSDVASRLRLRSANRHQLIVPQHAVIVPRCRLNRYGRRAFSIAGPTVWNSLPDELRDPAWRGSDSFTQFLKTDHFTNMWIKTCCVLAA